MALSSPSRRLEQGRVQEGAAAMGAGSPGREGGRGVGENGEEAKGISFPSSPWAAVERGGGSTAAGRGGRSSLLRRCCKVGEGSRGGEGGSGGRELREDPTHRPGEAVERAGQVTGW